jgi:hypothetical protein
MALLVDDAQWLDGSTTAALAFVARRLESDPIVLIVALRDGFGSPFLEAGLPELSIGALTDAQARSLLEACSPELDSGRRDRVLRSAAGNPLALVELSSALRSSFEADLEFHGSDLPLTARLERAFADRLNSLDADTCTFLRVAAVSDSGRLEEVLNATSRLQRREIALDVATKASAAGLILIDGPELRFRHPLMRSAIHQAMRLEDRQATHAALAETLEADTDRRAWHRVAASTGTRDEIAAELDGIRDRAFKRSALAVAMEAAARGAKYAVDPKLRGKLLMRAATYAWIMGAVSDVQRLLDIVDPRSCRRRAMFSTSFSARSSGAAAGPGGQSRSGSSSRPPRRCATAGTWTPRSACTSTSRIGAGGPTRTMPLVPPWPPASSKWTFRPTTFES